MDGTKTWQDGEGLKPSTFYFVCVKCSPSRIAGTIIGLLRPSLMFPSKPFVKFGLCHTSRF